MRFACRGQVGGLSESDRVPLDLDACQDLFDEILVATHVGFGGFGFRGVVDLLRLLLANLSLCVLGELLPFPKAVLALPQGLTTETRAAQRICWCLRSRALLVLGPLDLGAWLPAASSALAVFALRCRFLPLGGIPCGCIWALRNCNARRAR